MEGWMRKRSAWLRKWRKRYFRLDGFTLRMFVEQADRSPRRLDRIRAGTKFTLGERTTAGYVFKLTFPDTSERLRLAVKTASERKQWVAALQQACSLADDNVAPDHPGGVYCEGTSGAIAVIRFLRQNSTEVPALFTDLQASSRYAESLEPEFMQRLAVAMEDHTPGCPGELPQLLASAIATRNPHLLVAALKMHLRGRAKGPLVPSALYNAVLAAFQGALGHGDARTQAAALHPLLREVPDRQLLKELCLLLKASSTGESSYIKAFTMGYSVLRHDITDLTALQDLVTKPKLVVAIVQLMIDECEMVFADALPDDADGAATAASTSAGAVLARPPAFTRESLRHITTEAASTGTNRLKQLQRERKQISIAFAECEDEELAEAPASASVEQTSHDGSDDDDESDDSVSDTKTELEQSEGTDEDSVSGTADPTTVPPEPEPAPEASTVPPEPEPAPEASTVPPEPEPAPEASTVPPEPEPAPEASTVPPEPEPAPEASTVPPEPEPAPERKANRRRSKSTKIVAKLNSKSKVKDNVRRRRPKKGDKDYGCPVPGSKTAERAAMARKWVQAQLRILFGAIGRLGHADQDSWSVSFGTLFLAYQDISDAVVGILRRARKNKLLTFKGDMLLQGFHDSVMIRVTAKGMSYIRDLRTSDVPAVVTALP